MRHIDVLCKWMYSLIISYLAPLYVLYEKIVSIAQFHLELTSRDISLRQQPFSAIQDRGYIRCHIEGNLWSSLGTRRLTLSHIFDEPVQSFIVYFLAESQKL